MEKIRKILNAILTIVLVMELSLALKPAKAAGAWKGYAVYRDGVLGIFNDHAAMMIENDYTYTKPIVHANGSDPVKKTLGVISLMVIHNSRVLR